MGKELLGHLGRVGVKLLWSFLGKDEKQPGRVWRGLGSIRDCQGALLAES